MILATGILAIFHPGRSLTGPESEFSKMITQKGYRRWWCLGRRTRRDIDPDFQMNERSEDGDALPHYDTSKRTHRHHKRRHSRGKSDRQYLHNSYELNATL